MTLAPDVSLGHRYRLLSRIATGGMGEVWRAEDTVLHRQVAVKVLRGDLSSDASFLDRFRREAQNTAALSHPGIANVFDYGEMASPGGGRDDQPDLAYLVMELVDGEPLSAMLAREGRLDPDRALDILAQTALALQAAHDAGVVHRDVKPGNILVRPDGTVKITDFGIARVVDAAPMTRTGQVLGTAYYLSPEQAAGREATAASDVYALGVVGYECLTGQRPFAGDNAVAVAMQHVRDEPPPLPDHVPPPARAVVETAMAKEPAQRFESAGALGAAASTARTAIADPDGATAVLGAAGEPTAVLAGAAGPPTRRLEQTQVMPGAAPPPQYPRSHKRQRRWPRPAILLLGAIALGIAIALLLNAFGDDAGNPGPTGTPTPTPTPSQSTSTSPTASATVTVPNVVGQNADDAEQTLTDAGFDVTRTEVASSQQDDGDVVAQSPDGDTEAPRGSTVTLQVSSGPASVEIDAGDYVGENYAEVRRQLERLGLAVSPSYTGTGERPGTVTDVSPSGTVRAGSTITVTVVPENATESAEPTPPSPTASSEQSGTGGSANGNAGKDKKGKE